MTVEKNLEMGLRLAYIKIKTSLKISNLEDGIAAEMGLRLRMAVTVEKIRNGDCG